MSGLKIIEFPSPSLISLFHIIGDEDVRRNVGIFFQPFGLEANFDSDYDLPTDRLFTIPVQVFDTNAAIKLQLYELTLDPDRNKSRFGKRIFSKKKHPYCMCFYDALKTSKRSALGLTKDRISVLGLNTQNVLFLFIEINENGNDENDESGSDIPDEMSHTNVQLIKWSLNAKTETTLEIIQGFVHLAFVNAYCEKCKQIDSSKCLKGDIPFEKEANWSMNSKEVFPITVIRSLDLVRTATAYNSWFNPYGYSNKVMLVWKCPESLNANTLSSSTKTSNKPSYYAFDPNDTLESIHKEIVSSNINPVSILNIRLSPKFIYDSIHLKDSLYVRSFVVLRCQETLNLTELIQCFMLLHYLIIVRSDILVKELEFPRRLFETMKHLVLVDCNLQEVPEAIGSLIRLTLLNVSDNKISTLPVILGNLRELKIFLYNKCPLEFPPKNVLKRPAQDVTAYLRAFQNDEDTLAYNEAKLIIVGQDGVGKSTLIKAMQRKQWLGVRTKSPEKTDGVEILTLTIENTRFIVYDLAGDVEYLNTHPVFLSSKCLHLVVFDLSQGFLSKETRSTDLLCRLELWLQIIASQCAMSHVIIVGTHADDRRVTSETLSIVRKQIITIMRKHRCRNEEYFDKCMMCNAINFPEELQNEMKEVDEISLDEKMEHRSSIPHIFGYFEVSSMTKYPRATGSLSNKSIQSLKEAIVSCNNVITNKQSRIPKSWLSFYQNIISTKEHLPLISFDDFLKLASESGVPEEEMSSMLRFFHSHGKFLWYEDIPEMICSIITEPQWLSNQLRKLISHKPALHVFFNGILHSSLLSEVWPDICDEKRKNLLALFRNFELCFNILNSEQELFPCKLPIGWPDRRKWPLRPEEDEAETSLLFTFSFVHPTFFPKLIVEVNRRRDSFSNSLEPLFFRFHILYLTNSKGNCDIHIDEQENATRCHKIHWEIMPYNNTLKVSIRGPTPCCVVSDICSMVKDCLTNNYPGILYQTEVICPLCEMEKIDDPSTFSLDSLSENNICPKSWHNVGATSDIIRGKFPSPQREETRRVVGETLADFHCPKLFVIIPINSNSLSFKDRFVYSYLKDGYAVHLLCECPQQWHFVRSPGFRISKPKEFLEKYGKHLCTVMKAIGKLGAPFRVGAGIDPICKAGSSAASSVASKAKELESFLSNIFERYPSLKTTCYEDLGDLKSSSGLLRSELAQLLETVVKGREFGPLVFTYVDKTNEWLWLCEEHSKRFEIID